VLARLTCDACHDQTKNHFSFHTVLLHAERDEDDSGRYQCVFRCTGGYTYMTSG